MKGLSWKRKEQLTLRISLGVMTSVFSMVPLAAAADTSYGASEEAVQSRDKEDNAADNSQKQEVSSSKKRLASPCDDGEKERSGRDRLTGSLKDRAYHADGHDVLMQDTVIHRGYSLDAGSVGNAKRVIVTVDLSQPVKIDGQAGGSSAEARTINVDLDRVFAEKKADALAQEKAGTAGKEQGIAAAKNETYDLTGAVNGQHVLRSSAGDASVIGDKAIEEGPQASLNARYGTPVLNDSKAGSQWLEEQQAGDSSPEGGTQSQEIYGKKMRLAIDNESVNRWLEKKEQYLGSSDSSANGEGRILGDSYIVQWDSVNHELVRVGRDDSLTYTGTAGTSLAEHGTAAHEKRSIRIVGAGHFEKVYEAAEQTEKLSGQYADAEEFMHGIKENEELAKRIVAEGKERNENYDSLAHDAGAYDASRKDEQTKDMMDRAAGSATVNPKNLPLEAKGNAQEGVLQDIVGADTGATANVGSQEQVRSDGESQLWNGSGEPSAYAWYREDSMSGTAGMQEESKQEAQGTLEVYREPEDDLEFAYRANGGKRTVGKLSGMKEAEAGSLINLTEASRKSHIGNFDVGFHVTDRHADMQAKPTVDVRVGNALEQAWESREAELLDLQGENAVEAGNAGKVQEARKEGMNLGAAKTSKEGFTIRNICLDAVGLELDQAELTELLNPLLQQEVTLKELGKAAKDITTYCRSHGYPAAAAVIPPQESEDGTVRIQVIPGRYGKVQLDNQSSMEDAVAETAIGAWKTGEIIQAKTVEGALRSLKQISGAKVVCEMAPGKEFGTCDLTVHIGV